jgi:hypothetical protein
VCGETNSQDLPTAEYKSSMEHDSLVQVEKRGLKRNQIVVPGTLLDELNAIATVHDLVAVLAQYVVDQRQMECHWHQVS